MGPSNCSFVFLRYSNMSNQVSLWPFDVAAWHRTVTNPPPFKNDIVSLSVLEEVTQLYTRRSCTWIFGSTGTPPKKVTPLRNKAWIRPYQGKLMVKKPLESLIPGCIQKNDTEQDHEQYKLQLLCLHLFFGDVGESSSIRFFPKVRTNNTVLMLFSGDL